MAESKVNICNQALLMLGSDTITSLDESDKRATHCSVLYDPTRKALLRRHNWGFARARRDLAQLSTAPDFGFEYYYQLPSDCLRIRGIYQDSEMPFTDRYSVESNKIAINISPCRIIYTRNVENPREFDALFDKALAAWLAWELALPISGSSTRKERMSLSLEYYLDTAQSVDATEGAEHIEATSDYMQAR